MLQHIIMCSVTYLSSAAVNMCVIWKINFELLPIGGRVARRLEFRVILHPVKLFVTILPCSRWYSHWRGLVAHTECPQSKYVHMTELGVTALNVTKCQSQRDMLRTKIFVWTNLLASKLTFFFHFMARIYLLQIPPLKHGTIQNHQSLVVFR